MTWTTGRTRSFALAGLLAVLLAAPVMDGKAASPWRPRAATAGGGTGGAAPAQPEDPTAAWPVYVNPIYGWEIRYPPDWTLAATIPCVSSTTVLTEILRDRNDFTLHNLRVLSTADEPRASEQAALFIQNDLTGWAGATASRRSAAGGAQAHVLSGPVDDYFMTVAVVWEQQKVVQMSFADTPDRTEQRTLDLMLASFRFVPQETFPC